MTLGEKQRLFARLVPRLLDEIHRQGFEATLGDAYRDERVFGPIGASMGYGHPKSAHKQRLAIDLNLFRNGEYLRGTAAHQTIGEWWIQQHAMCRWGGAWGDGNHYSLEHQGIK